MSILAIDWGEKRIGLALSEDGHFAFPLVVATSVDDVKRILETRKVEKIILGLPIGLSGNETEKTKEVETFYQALLRFGIPIEKVDERYSTKMVPREGRGSDMKDAVSAQLLLQEYLDRGKPDANA